MKNFTHYGLLFGVIIIARSTSFLFSKTCLVTMGPFTLLSLRFVLASVLLIGLFHRRLCTLTLPTVCRGAVLGALFFALMAFETLGLKTTSTSTTALLENTAIIAVPLLAAALQRKVPTPASLVCAGIAFCGAALIILQGGGLQQGMGISYCLLAAGFYAVCILTTDHLAGEDDPMILGILQVCFMGLFSTAAAFVFETPALPQTTMEWGAVLELAVVCSGFGFALQPLAQRGISAEQAGLLCAITPASATLLGWAFLHESLGLPTLLGLTLILTALVAASILPRTADGVTLSE